MAFRVGQKVVYVGRPDGLAQKTYPNVLAIPGEVTVGAVYTIREIDDRYVAQAGEPALRLVEFVFPAKLCVWGHVEPAFRCSYFRPAVERKTDTGFAILASILKGQRVPEGVER